MKKIVLAMLLIIFLSFGLGDACLASTNETITFSCYTTTSLTKTISVTADSNVIVDWGDGNIEEQSAIDGVDFIHSYSNSGVYEISITGDNISGFFASRNDIFNIDLTNASSLVDIDLSHNKLSDINFNNNLLLEIVLIEDNNLNSLKINASNLLELNCSNNNLASINIPNTVINLYFANNLISSFDFSDFSNLKVLTCDDNELTNLSLEDSPELKVLSCCNNSIKSFSFNSNPKLKILECYGNELQEINLKNNINLEVLNCFSNKLTSLDITNNINLDGLYIFNNQISNINLNSIEMSTVVADKTTNISNANVQGLTYLESNKIEKIYLDSTNVMSFSSEPKELSINGVQQVIDGIEIDISDYTGTNTVTIVFDEDEELVNVNAPQLAQGMIPVKYNGTNWVITNAQDEEWYNYNEANKKWANVMLRDDAYYLDLDGKTLKSVGDIRLDELNGKEVPENYTGSMYVWIPRFTYKISSTDIAVNYSQGITDYTSDGYKVHPAFNHSKYIGGNPNDEKNYENLTNADKYLGIWVAKFPAGKSISAPKFASNVTLITGNNIGEMFSASKLVSSSLVYRVSGIKSHMIKNSEWGAVSYLTTAVGNLENSSTTGNIYGIFGMDTGAEYVSSFIELVGGVSNFSVRKNGKGLLPYNIISYNNYEVADEKDIEIYRLNSATDNSSKNYEALNSFYGIGINEIGTSISGNVTLNMPFSSNAFFTRGIDGIYSYSGVTGVNSNNIGFRNSILITTSLANDNTKTYTISATSTSGGRISPIGNTVLKSGSSITYSIIPDEGKELIDVLVDNVSVYNELVDNTTYYTYKFNNVTTNHTISAVFIGEIAEYNVTVIESPTGSGEIVGAGPVMSRSTVTLTANKKRGYKFSSWEVKEGLTTAINKTSKTTTFKMPANDVILQANFVEALKVSLTVENLYSSLIMEQFEENRISIEATEGEYAKFKNWTSTGLTLTEAQEQSPRIIFTMPPNDVKLVANYIELPKAEDVPVGAYIEYTPSNESVTVLGSDSGFGGGDQTYWPQEYTKGWKVFKNTNGQLDIISAENVLTDPSGGEVTLALEGEAGYANYVDTLNTLSEGYINPEYAYAGRSFGAIKGKSVERIDSKTLTYEHTVTNGNNGFPYIDELYKSDKEIIDSNIQLEHSGNGIWVASRYLSSYGTKSNFSLMFLYNGRVDSVGSLLAESDSSSTGYSDFYGVRPIISLKSGIKITGGTGTADDPYTISYEPKTVNDIAVGSYVSYQPSNESITVFGEDSGYTDDGTYVDQTYYPKTYTGGWQVFENNSGQLDIISSENVLTDESGTDAGLIIQGLAGYTNYVDTLNTISEGYINPTYATAARSLGAIKGSSVEKIKPDTVIHGVNTFPYIDTLYEADLAIINTQINGTYPLRHTDSTDYISLASRHLEAGSNTTYFYSRCVDNSGGLWTDRLYSSNIKPFAAPLSAVRPIVSLRADIRVVSGSGTEADPYILSN